MEEHHHTKVYIAGLGTIEFRYVSGRDIEAFFTLVEGAQNLTDREFVLAVLHQQLISPSVTIERLHALSDKNISRMAVAFMQGEPTLFTDVGDMDEIYTTFRSTLEQHAAASQERAQKHLEPFRVEAERKFEKLRATIKNIQTAPSPEGHIWNRPVELEVSVKTLNVLKEIYKEQKGSSVLGKWVFGFTLIGLLLQIVQQVLIPLYEKMEGHQNTPTATSTAPQTNLPEKKLPEIRAYSPKG